MDLQTIVRQNLVRSLVANSITCIRSGEVLDVRTCVVLNDKDGDPMFVLSQAGWASLVALHAENGTDVHADLARIGMTLDASTVKA